jgi:transcription-repair coupling factor (superfamily II helicase)
VELSALVRRYISDSRVSALLNRISESTPAHIAISGLVGSQQSFIFAAIAVALGRNLVIIVNDREEALYILSDLEQLLPDVTLLFFPASCKRPYQIDTIENANVMQRAETLHAINQAALHPDQGKRQWIAVSYPEALCEKVLNRKTLSRNTFEVKVGERIGMGFAVEVLTEYGFEATDFVYEPGQFAVRGGILDVFSFSHDKPYRMEFWGDELESIRIFDPISQISIENLTGLSLIPNVRTQLLQEERVNLLEFVPANTVLCVQHVRFLLDEVAKSFTKAQQMYELIAQEHGGQTRRSSPELLYTTPELQKSCLALLHCIEFGTKVHVNGQSNNIISFEGSSPQPHFKKEFELLAGHLIENQQLGIENIICAENPRQLTRLAEIFNEISPSGARFTPLQAGLYRGFRDSVQRIACYTDHQIFERYHRFRARNLFSRAQALTLKELRDLHPGDYVTHINHGIGRFAGLEKTRIGDKEQEAVKLLFQDDDVVYVHINALHKISKYIGKEGAQPKLSKIGSAEWAKTRARVKKRVRELAFDLVALYAKRRAQRGYSFGADTYLQAELEASFFFEDTPDQQKAIEAVKHDMQQPYPMDRLICGDVGFGKTEIAIRAAFKSVCEGKQVAVLVPTTVLAIQHFQTFRERMAQFSVKIDYLNRFRTAKETKQILKDLAEGKIEILIGTHRLLSKDVVFKDLGLLVIDEEHKFGVGAKEKLRLLKSNVDTLTMTATPIPRTLQFSLLQIRDMSIIATPPPNRQPVSTVVQPFDSETVRDALAYELRRGGQAFFIHNRIADLEEHAAMIKKLVPDARVVVAHGQMPGDKLEEVMYRFINHEFDILVCTTIIESGLDIPNANTIIINAAHMYGLSDLHQMRGRVGRSNRKAFCYLLAPPLSVLPADSRKRLQAIEEFSDLGSGLQIAMRDLDIRGAGDILGAEQSGFINDMGYEAYQQILEETIAELKAEYFPDLAAETPPRTEISDDCQLETDLTILIPDSYIRNTAERLSFYKRISESTDEKTLIAISREMSDRFGLIPEPVLSLLDSIRVRELAKKLGFDRLVLKDDILRCFFVTDKAQRFNESPAIGAVIQWAQQHSQCRLKQVNEKLILQIPGIKSIKEMLFSFREMYALIPTPSQ